mmetsp:Transcript_14563/g.27389  ORF Transcript_14563/g.27389 Transcript_14563/m.27389 type:complete len:89 (-) Transcript_14563:4111-4377(-)
MMSLHFASYGISILQGFILWIAQTACLGTKVIKLDLATFLPLNGPVTVPHSTIMDEGFQIVATAVYTTCQRTNVSNCLERITTSMLRT